MGLRKTTVAIDTTLLSAVQEVLGTRTLRETIEQSFLEVLRVRARLEEVEALSKMEGMDLANDDIMGGAWRQ
ncbi:MAG: hypothetical protein ABI333_22200 [bacterium]